VSLIIIVTLPFASLATRSTGAIVVIIVTVVVCTVPIGLGSFAVLVTSG
jgi:hypothetical protein